MISSIPTYLLLGFCVLVFKSRFSKILFFFNWKLLHLILRWELGYNEFAADCQHLLHEVCIYDGSGPVCVY
jgi:hypothetical protein